MTNPEQEACAYLSRIWQQIADAQNEHRSRIATLEREMFRQKEQFRRQIEPLLRERDAIGAMLATAIGLRTPPPTIVRKDIVRKE